ncbi:VanW family protein [Ornithinibacillus sp. BX22]|uniref:VanW family protein n=1 Tax=Ornithinibacillus hominis TaxID=2763055 RepID=A0A923L6L2_9BACI|nr:G5 domain-containing protein [Ornithinibacillus hominis]MBC5637455.1 VanW family protein [Ornithinibacillus hominis]
MNIAKKAIIYFSILIVISILVIASFMFLGAFSFPKGSQVAGIDVEGLTVDEAKEVLQKEINDWQKQPSMVAVSEHEELEIPRAMFQFDIEKSLKNLKEKVQENWLPFIKRKNIHIPLELTLAPDDRFKDWPTYIDVPTTMKKATTLAENLQEAPIAIVYHDEREPYLHTVVDTSVELPNGLSSKKVEMIVESINGQTIKPKESFSILGTLPKLSSDSQQEVNFVASNLYALVLQTNLTVLERHSQEVIPAYLEPGMGVNINTRTGKDLVLYNPNDNTYTLTLSQNGDHLKLSINALTAESTLGYRVARIKQVEPRTIYRYSKDLGFGESTIIQEGEAGLEVAVYRNDAREEELISRDFYPPVPKIVVVPFEDEISEMNRAADEMLLNNTVREEDISSGDEQQDRNHNDGSVRERLTQWDNPKAMEGFIQFVILFCDLPITDIDLAEEDIEEAIIECIEKMDADELHLLSFLWNVWNLAGPFEFQLEQSEEMEADNQPNNVK